MRLLLKITGVLFLLIFFLLAIDGYFLLRHGISLFYNDMRGDALLVGHLMSGLIEEVWRGGGEKRAFELIKEANMAENQVKIRWVWLDALRGDPYAPHIQDERLGPLFRGQEISIKESVDGGVGSIHTYVPIKIGGKRHAALELTESLSTLAEYTHKTIIRVLSLSGVLILTSGIILWILGTRFIHLPVKRLIEKMHRIGAGDLSVDPGLTGHDELSDLMLAINRMCEQLAAAQESARIENEKRVATLEQLRHTERLATLGRIASGIAHELGTPLNVVAGRAKLLTTENMNKEEIIENSGIICEQVDRMTKIIRQLLDFARRGKSQRTLTNMHNLIAQVLDMLTPIARKTNVTTLLTENESIPMVAVDQFQLQQVLLNLIMNGIQAMPNGGRLKLELRHECTALPSQEKGEKKNYLTIYIKDEGMGISKENIEHIFEPFFTTKRSGKGSGLGLSIAYGIVEDHNGWICVESEPGKGSCFTVYLPMETKG